MQIDAHNGLTVRVGTLPKLGTFLEIMNGEKRIHGGSKGYIALKWKKLTGRSL
jgi:hypothetical protein